jgi:hypothetical protein
VVRAKALRDGVATQLALGATLPERTVAPAPRVSLMANSAGDAGSLGWRTMKTVLAIPVLLAFACSAYADDTKGFYAGAGVGMSNVKIDNVSDVGAALGEFDGDDVSFKAFAGWRFGKFISVEVDYLDLGKPEDELGNVSVSTGISGFAPYLVGTLPLGPIELSAKAGYLFYDLEVSADLASSRKTSDDDLVYGVGIGLTVFDRLATKLEYERIEISQLDRSDALWLTAAWRF